MFLVLFISFMLALFLVMTFVRSLLSGKEDLFSLARKQRRIILDEHKKENNKNKITDEDNDVVKMLTLMSPKDDEIDYNK